MSKKNGKEKQDSVLAQFSRDAKMSTNTSAVATALEAGIKLKEYQEKKRIERENKVRMVPSSPGYYNL